VGVGGGGVGGGGGERKIGEQKKYFFLRPDKVVIIFQWLFLSFEDFFIHGSCWGNIILRRKEIQVLNGLCSFVLFCMWEAIFF
jgi:hypothetical protein